MGEQMTATNYHRPWSHLCDDPAFAEKHGHWADYAAWEQWVGARAAKLCDTMGDDLEAAWGEMDGLARAGLYVLMCDATDAAKGANGNAQDR
jgi:hypothetical protein